MALSSQLPTTASGPGSGLDADLLDGSELADVLITARQVAVNAQTGTAYVLVLADAGKVVEISNALANTATVPPNSAVAFPIGTIVKVFQAGVGATSVVAGSGVTIRNNVLAAISAQYGGVSLYKRATDEWVKTDT